MKVHFAKVISGHNDTEINYGFLIRITSILELIDYWMRVRTGFVSTGFYDYSRSREYAKLCGYSPKQMVKHKVGLDHVHSSYGAAIALLAEIKGHPKGVIGLIGDFEDRIFKDQAAMIEKHDAIYINHNCGYFWHDDSVKVEKVVTKEDYVFPEFTDADIKIIQWRGGKHYYAKVGGIDVVWEGEQKWNTRRAAREAAKNFLKEQEKI